MLIFNRFFLWGLFKTKDLDTASQPTTPKHDDFQNAIITNCLRKPGSSSILIRSAFKG